MVIDRPMGNRVWMLVLLCAGLMALALGATRPAAAFNPQPDLTIGIDELTADPTTPGAPVAYAVRVSNIGDLTASYVKVKILLPGAFAFPSVSAPAQSGFACTVTGGGAVAWTITCTAGVLPPTISPTTISVATVAPFTLPAGIGSLTTTAEIDPDRLLPERDEGNNTASEITGFGLADLQVSLASDPTTVRAGGALTIAATARNTGGVSASGVTVRVTLPNIANPQGITSTAPLFLAGCDGPPINLVVTCRGGVLPPGSAATIQLRLFPFSNLSGANVNVSATIDPTNTVVESNESNNGSTLILPVQTLPDLRLSASGERLQYTCVAANLSCFGAPINLGQVTATVRNQGGAAAPATTIVLDVPSGVRANANPCASGFRLSGGSCVDALGLNQGACRQNGVGRNIECDVPALAPGAQFSFFTILDFPLTLLPTTYQFDVEVDRGHLIAEGSEANNEVTVTISI